MLYEGLVLDEERALYGICNSTVRSCGFYGAADGESALKETNGLSVTDCEFRLRYPMWHMRNSSIDNCRLSESCRAPLWYCDSINIANSVVDGVKSLRECRKTKITDSTLASTELGWFCEDISFTGCTVLAEYPFLKTKDLNLSNVKLQGKYSFQYVENAVIDNCTLDTKDAFWHAKNVVVRDSVVKGEYLAWYSENVTFERCKIIGTQPLCYCKNLTLIDCEMIECDLSFERSEVVATIKGAIDSVKNPVSGNIKADSIGQIFIDLPTTCKIKTIN